MPFILQSNGHTIGDGGEGDHPLAPHSKLTYGAATTSLTAATDDEDMIDITPRSSPGELIGGGPGSYHRETATESDTERDYAPNQRTMHHHHQLQHQHVPSHSAFGDPMDGEWPMSGRVGMVWFVNLCHDLVVSDVTSIVTAWRKLYIFLLSYSYEHTGRGTGRGRARPDATRFNLIYI